MKITKLEDKRRYAVVPSYVDTNSEIFVYSYRSIDMLNNI